MKKILRVLGYLLRSDSGRRHPVRVLGRFMWLQIHRKLLRRAFAFRTVTGTRASIAPTGDFQGLSLMYYFELPDHEENAFACHLLRPGEVFWDVGANLGYWDLLLAGRGIEVHAFEPVPTTFAGLERQFALQVPEVNGRMHAHHIGMSTQSGRMRFTTDQGTANRMISGDETYPGSTVEVRVTPLDEVTAPPPAFIKIDVEGWTIPVLEGATRLLAAPGLLAVLIETFRFADWDKPEIRRIEEILAGHGFQPHRYDPVSRVLRPLRDPSEGRQDTLYVRDASGLGARLREAPAVCCLGDVY